MKQSLDTRTKLLTKNPISLMIELSIPAVLGMVVVGLYNMMDSIFVGQMVGAAQMGAVSVSYPFTLINAGSAAMLGVGSASVLSRAIGKKDERTIKKIMGNLVAMVLLFNDLIGEFITPQIDSALNNLHISDDKIPEFYPKILDSCINRCREVNYINVFGLQFNEISFQNLKNILDNNFSNANRLAPRKGNPVAEENPAAVGQQGQTMEG